MLYKKNKLIGSATLAALLALSSVSVHADDLLPVKPEVCGEPVPGIAYVFTIMNLHTGQSEKGYLGHTACVAAQVGDVIRYDVVAGATIGNFYVENSPGQIPLGGGLKLWGSFVYPKLAIYSPKS